MTNARAAVPDEILVYLVDDEEQDVDLATDALLACQTPNRVRTFANGRELVKAMTSELEKPEPQESPDLILLDLQMPRMNGLQTLEWIRGQESLTHIPVIIFSSVRDQEQISLAFELGCNGVIDKNEVDVDLTDSLDILEQYWISKSAHQRGAGPGSGHSEAEKTVNLQK